MRQIGTTENGDALVQMTWKEWGIYSMVDLENVIKVLDQVNEVGEAVSELIDIFHSKPSSPKGFHHITKKCPRIKAEYLKSMAKA